MKIREYLKENILIADGAMGTLFARQNTDPDICAEEGSFYCPDVISKIHREYLEAGAKFIRTNTFDCGHRLAEKAGLFEKEEQREYIRRMISTAWDLAAREVEEHGGDAFIAADIGPSVLESFDEDYDAFEECRFMIDVFLEKGADIFDFETFPEAELIKKAAGYIKEKSPESFVIASFAANRTGYTTRGKSLKKLFEDAGACGDIDCIGCNCLMNSLHMKQQLQKLFVPEDKFFLAMPNSGYEMAARSVASPGSGAGYFGFTAAGMTSLGVNILGGCCGTTPEHIRVIKENVHGAPEQRVHVIRASESGPVRKFSRSNTFAKKLDEGTKVVAVELDPPYDRNAASLGEGAFALKEAGVDIITLADSPLARTRADSVMLAARIKSMTDVDVMPHIAMRDRNRIALKASLLGAYISDIRNLLIITGDPVPSGERGNTRPVFDFNSIRFMKFVREMNREELSDDPFSFGGAINQGLPGPEKQAERIKRKMEAGASYFLTQPVYSDEDIERLAFFRERTGAKILCGIMPLVSYKNALFIKNEMPGMHVPDEVLSAYDPGMSRAEAEDAAVCITSKIIEKAAPVTDGIYYMTPFNRVSLIVRLMENLKNG